MMTSLKVCVATVLASVFATGCAPEGWNERVEYAQAAPPQAAPTEETLEQRIANEQAAAPQAATQSAPEPAAAGTAEAIDGTTANPAAIASGEEVPIGVEPPAATPAQPPAQYEETDPSALTDFRPVLEPYGTWEDDSTYGTVWYPSASQVGTDFTPYSTGGHWSHDGYEYVWVSDYDWGWAPFHYGRWIYINGRGWAWVPGRVYRGAWVNWRVGPVGYGYIGWAPMVPTWYWYHGYAYGIGVSPYAPYSFCATRDLFHPQVGGRVIRGQNVVNIARGTRPFVSATPSVAGGGPRANATPGIENPGARSRDAYTNRGQAAYAAHAPPLSHLGVKSTQVVKTPNDSPSFARAKQFGDPRMRSQLGLHALPSRHEGVIGMRPAPTPRTNEPRFGGAPRLGSNPRFSSPHDGPSYRSPPVVRPSAPPRTYDPSPRFGGTPRFESPAPRLHPSPNVRPNTPNFRPSAPAYRPATPSFRPSAPSLRPPAPAVRPSAPSFRPSSPSVRPSAPSFRPSSPSFRPSTPSFRPSSPPSRPSSPSRSGGFRGGRR